MPIAKRLYPILMGEKGDLDVVEVDNTIRNTWMAVFALQEDLTIMQEKVGGAIRRGEIAEDDTDASITKVDGATRTSVVTAPTTITGAKLVNPISNRLPFVNAALELDGGLNAPEYNPSTKALTIRGAVNITGAITGLSTMAITGAVTMASTLAVTGIATFSDNLVMGGSAGQQLIVFGPDNDDNTPSLAFGDGDTGFYEQSDDTLDVSIGASRRCRWNSTHFRSTSSGGWSLSYLAATESAPTYQFQGDSNTGMGHGDPDIVTLVTGGTVGFRCDASQRTQTYGRIKTVTRKTTTYTILVTDGMIFGNTDGGAWTATLPAGFSGQTFRIINSGSSGNILTVAPNGSEHLLGVNSSFSLFDAEALDLTYDATDGWY